jgi:hypothetical protein
VFSSTGFFSEKNQQGCFRVAIGKVKRNGWSSLGVFEIIVVCEQRLQLEIVDFRLIQVLFQYRLSGLVSSI